MIDKVVDSYGIDERDVSAEVLTPTRGSGSRALILGSNKMRTSGNYSPFGPQLYSRATIDPIPGREKATLGRSSQLKHNFELLARETPL